MAKSGTKKEVENETKKDKRTRLVLPLKSGTQEGAGGSSFRPYPKSQQVGGKPAAAKAPKGGRR